MTTQLPLFPAVGAQAPAQGQNVTPDNALSSGAGANPFQAILQGLPAASGGGQDIVKALRQLLSALGNGSGKGLPGNLTADQLAALLKEAGPQLKAELSQALRQLDPGGAVTATTGDLVALLQQLLGLHVAPEAGGSPQSGAASSGTTAGATTAAAALSLAGAAQGTADSAQPSDPSQTQEGGAGTAAAAPAGSAAATPSAIQIQQLVAQLLQSAAAAAPGGDTSGTSPALTDNGAGGGPLTELLAKLFPQSTGKEKTEMQALSASDKTLLAVLGTDRQVPAAGAPGGGSSPTPLYNPVQAGTAAAAATPAAAQSVPLSVPFNQQGWDQALGHSVLWMVRNDVQVASMRLNPPQLGPLEVRVSFNNDQATVTFVAHHTGVRDAVEAALPRLRDMFADGGINLGNVDVSGQSPSGRGGASRDADPQSGGAAGGAVSEEGTVQPAPVAAAPPLGLVDYFA